MNNRFSSKNVTVADEAAIAEFLAKNKITQCNTRTVFGSKQLDRHRLARLAKDA